MSSSKTRPRVESDDAGFQAGPQALVAIAYDLYDEEGELVESSDDDQPVEFVFGYGQIAPGIERAVAGSVAGDMVPVTLLPEEAFGPRDENAIVEIDRSDFPRDVAAGDEFEAEDAGGALVGLKVLEVGTEAVVVDANHALAGQKVRFELRLEAVRPATAEELAVAEALLEAASGKGALIPAHGLIQGAKGGYEGPQPTDPSGRKLPRRLA